MLIRLVSFALDHFIFSCTITYASVIDSIADRMLPLTIALYFKILYNTNDTVSLNLMCFTKNGEILQLNL